LLWIGVMLIPSIVTTGAPNFTRTLGALPMVFAMPGIAVETVMFWAPRLFPLQYYQTASRVTTAIIGLGLIVVLGINAASTYEDYFVKWPQHPETQFVFQADFAAIAKDIDASDVMDVSVGGLSNDTMDDPSLYLLRNRKDVRVRWFDSGSDISAGGALLKANAPEIRIYRPKIIPISPMLNIYTYPGNEVSTSSFTLYRLYSNTYSATLSLRSLPYARYFADTAAFIPLGLDRLGTAVGAGNSLAFESWWLALSPIESPRRIFVHLVDPQTGKPVAQHDGLDSPSRFWQSGDAIQQVHRLHIPADTPSGDYELWIGLYNPETGQRILQTNFDHTEPPSDHIVLGTIKVVR